MSVTQAETRPSREILAWRNAVFALFAVGGLAFATWVARLPTIRDTLELSTSAVGVLIFVLSLGSVLGLLTSALQIRRFGTRPTILFHLLLLATGLALAGVGGGLVDSPILTGAGLFIMGIGNGTVDVAMNIEGAAAERELRKTTMPLMHAFFSFGTVGGAALGALASALSISVFWHFLVVAGVIVATAFLTVRHLPIRATPRREQTDKQRAEADSAKQSFRQRLAVWADIRLVLIGVVMLGMAFAEGSANDWLALASVDGHGLSPTLGAVVFGVFTVAMAVGRACGGPLIDRFGRVIVLQISAGAAIVGLLMFILAPWPWTLVLGAILWGIGASLGFPVGMSAAADDPDKATARVSAVAAIGYAAFLVGPPLIGFVGDRVGLLNALYIVLALVILSGLASPAVRRPRRTAPPTPPTS